jgi:glycosyltransferase involved in cell wall biosynthesis
MTVMPLKVGFVLLSNSKNPQPSTRVAVLNMLPALREAGVEVELVFNPHQASETPDLSNLAKSLIEKRFDVVYFQKVRGESVQNCAQCLAKAGIATIYGVCDLVDRGMADATHMTLVVSEFLKSLYPAELQDKIHVVHDGIEQPLVKKTDFGSHSGSRAQPIRAVLVTSSSLASIPVLVNPPNWLEVTIVGRYPAKNAIAQRIKESRWAFAKMSGTTESLAYLNFLLNSRIKTQMWQAERVYATMQSADIGIIPIESKEDFAKGTNTPVWKVKSENRLTLKMSVGLPVIATPIPSYEPIVESGVNGFFATDRAEWIRSLEILRDPATRKLIGEKGRASVNERFSQRRQANLLIAALRYISESRSRL